MKALTILTDVDGVLADFVGGTCDALAVAGHPRRQPHEFDVWDISKKMTPEEVISWHAAVGSPGFARNLPWYPGAVHFLQSLKDLAHEVCALTAPWHSSPTWMHDRQEWLREHLNPKHIIFCPSAKKRLVRGDVLIEDRGRNADEWAEAHPRGLAILIERPWNTQEKTSHRVERYRTFGEVFTRLVEEVCS